MNNLSVNSFLNELETICLHTSIAIVSTRLDSFNYCSQTLLILFNINQYWCLQTVKWLQVLLFNTNYSIQHYSFICTQPNGYKYCYVIPIIKFRRTVKEFQVLLFNTSNSIQHYAFIWTLLNGSKYSTLIVLFAYNRLKYCYVSQII